MTIGMDLRGVQVLSIGWTVYYYIVFSKSKLKLIMMIFMILNYINIISGISRQMN
jgi:hypothetical protein